MKIESKSLIRALRQTVPPRMQCPGCGYALNCDHHSCLLMQQAAVRLEKYDSGMEMIRTRCMTSRGMEKSILNDILNLLRGNYGEECSGGYQKL